MEEKESQINYIGANGDKSGYHDSNKKKGINHGNNNRCSRKQQQQ